VAALDVQAPHRVSFKCSDERFVELQENEGVVPAPYLARAKWLAVERFDSLSDAAIEDGVRGSYELVKEKLTKKQQEALTSKRSPARPRTKSGSRAQSRRRG
jgi:predicted DNA-binding protein (MmcQ/YjbR family)